MRTVIKLRDHPCNNCRTSKRVSPARTPYAVYKCKHGFKPAWFDSECNVVTLEGYSETYEDAIRIAGAGEKAGFKVGTKL